MHMEEPPNTPVPDDFVLQGAEMSSAAERPNHRSRTGRRLIVIGCACGLASVPLAAQLPRMAEWPPDLAFFAFWLAILLPFLALILTSLGLVRARRRTLPTAEIVLII